MLSVIFAVIAIYIILGFGYASYCVIKYKEDVKKLESDEIYKKFVDLVLKFPYYLSIDFITFFVKFLVK